MKAILLCAGFATRLLPLTRNRAKPLLPVGGAPIVEHLLRSLDASGAITDVALVSNRRFYRDFVAWRDAVRFEHFQVEVLDNGVTREPERRGAVGDLLWAAQTTALDGPALVAAGDNLFRISFDAFFADVASRKGSVVAAYRERDPARLRRTGVAELDADGRVVSLVEKPAEPKSSWACPALYALSRSAIARLEAFVSSSSGADTDNLGSFLSWLVEREPVFAHPLQGERWDVGDRESYGAAEAFWSKGESA